MIRRNDDPPIEELHQEYLELLLAENAPPPNEFLSNRGCDNSELCDVLLRMYRSAPQRPQSERTREAEPQFKEIKELSRARSYRVVLAQQAAIDRKVVLKQSTGASPSARKQLLHEAGIVSALDHDCVARFYGAWDSPEHVTVALQALDGPILAQILVGETKARVGGRELTRRLRWVAEICQAISFVHSQGIVHVDLKPSNIIITERGPVLIDFGSARRLDEHEGASTPDLEGSPHYAPPELCRQEEVNEQSDVYSLGATLYHCLYGSPPHTGNTARVLHSIQSTPVSFPRARSRAERDLQQICRSALAKSRSDRYSDAESLAADLRAILEFRPTSHTRGSSTLRDFRSWRRRPIVRLSAAIALLLATLIGFMLSARENQKRALLARQQQQATGRAIRLARIHRQAAEKQDHTWEARYGGDKALNLDMHYASHVELRRAAAEREFLACQVEGRATYQTATKAIRSAQDRFGELPILDEQERQLLWREWRRSRFDQDWLRYLELLDEYERRWPGTANGECPPITIAVSDVQYYRFRPDRRGRWNGTDDRRCVLVPFDRFGRRLPLDADSPRPGDWVLEVLDDSGPLKRGDFVYAIEGVSVEQILHSIKQRPIRKIERWKSQSARVYRHGERLTVWLPAHADIQINTNPMLTSPELAWEAPLPDACEPEITLARSPGYLDGITFSATNIPPVKDYVPTVKTLYLLPIEVNGKPVRLKATRSAQLAMPYEVTWGQFRRFVASEWTERWYPEIVEFFRVHTRLRSAEFDNQPVTEVTWFEAVAFTQWCTWESSLVEGGLYFFLPISGSFSGMLAFLEFPWGFDLDPTAANLATNPDTKGILPVGSQPLDQTLCGFFDVAGNAREWRQEIHEGRARIAGGSWRTADPAAIRAGVNISRVANGRYSDVGFRAFARAYTSEPPARFPFTVTLERVGQSKGLPELAVNFSDQKPGDLDEKIGAVRFEWINGSEFINGTAKVSSSEGHQRFDVQSLRWNLEARPPVELTVTWIPVPDQKISWNVTLAPHDEKRPIQSLWLNTSQSDRTEETTITCRTISNDPTVKREPSANVIGERAAVEGWKTSRFQRYFFTARWKATRG